MSDDCIFCQIANKKIPAYRVYEDERSLAFADINPLTEGHVLVIPKNHAANLLEITPGDLAAVHQASQKVAQAVMKALKPAGISVLQLNGAGAGQVVMHYHLHIIPRNPPKDNIKFLNWEIKPGDMKAIEKMANKIKDAI
ncbi:MAG: HIT family protein [Thermodesulfobacteriota bacterium]